MSIGIEAIETVNHPSIPRTGFYDGMIAIMDGALCRVKRLGMPVERSAQVEPINSAFTVEYDDIAENTQSPIITTLSVWLGKSVLKDPQGTLFEAPVAPPPIRIPSNLLAHEVELRQPVQVGEDQKPLF